MSGSGTLRIGSTEETITPGTVLLISPNVYHSIRVHAGHPVHRHFIQFSYEESGMDGSSLQRQESLDIVRILSGIDYKLFADEHMDQTLRIIESIYIEKECPHTGFYSQLQSLITQLIIRLVRSLSLTPSIGTIPLKINDNMRTTLIDGFFDRYGEDLTIEDLASQLYLSTKQTNRIIKQFYGTSFKQKLLTTRIQIAMELLTTSDLSVESISEQVGYSSIYNFCKVFKQRSGLTPGQYRALQIGGS
jgi:AraC-like DNA-binding protein